jgi:toxin ParE1/3/4
VQIHWTNNAIRNLEEIEQYISQDNAIAAVNVVNKIIDAIELLTEHPGIGRPGRIIGTRELVIIGTPYLIPYRIKNQQIEIIRIFHGAKIWPENL